MAELRDWTRFIRSTVPAISSVRPVKPELEQRTVVGDQFVDLLMISGEYASHDHPTGKANNFLAALSEAAFKMCIRDSPYTETNDSIKIGEAKAARKNKIEWNK